ncbi:MAG: hypothetical protein OEO77_08550 [Acidimicrobiia bacterium]|nr:hypothetical protein [Acidimicrobiia bacterium]
MKLRKLFVVGAIAAAAAALLQKQRKLEASTPDGIWKPVDPLRPYGDRKE